MSKITLTDWSLGITDDIVDADPRSAKRLDNLVLNRQGKPCQRPALTLLVPNSAQIPPGNQKIDSVYYFDKTYFIKSATKLYYSDNGGAWTELSTLSSKAVFGDSVLGAGVSWSLWRGHVIATPMPHTGAVSGCRTVWMFRDTNNAWQAEQVGTPRVLDSGFTGSAVGSGGTDDKSYIGAVVLRHRHVAKVDGVDVTFIEYGEPGLVGVRNEAPVDALTGFSLNTINWTNAALDNYTDANSGTSSLRVALYRTKADESTLLLSDVVNQGASSLFDDPDSWLGAGGAFADEGSVDAIELYTTGGRKANGPVPLSQYSLILDGYGFYGAYVEPATSVMYHNRLVQSNPAQPTGVYTGNYVEFSGLMRGLTAVGSYPIILTSLGALRVEGRYDAFGGGGMRVFNIPGSEPAIAGKAAIQLDDAVVYASKQGWIWTNGFQAQNVSEHLRITYGTLANKENMSATYDRQNKLVLFGVEDPENDDVSGANNRLFVIDLKHSTPERGCFTTYTASTILQPNALGYDKDNKKVLIGDQRGYVLTFDETSYADLKVDASVVPDLWARVGIIWDLITPAFSGGNEDDEKFWSKVYGRFKRLTGYLSAQFSTFKDRDDTVEHTSKVITHRAKRGIHQVERWVSGGRWATFQQLRVKKALVVTANSDSLGTAHVETSADTVELLSGYWPLLDGGLPMTGYFIYFDFDNYETAFEISLQAGNVLTVLDPNNFLVQDPAAEWVIMGYPKDEGVEITSLSMEIEDEGDADNNYNQGDDGANEA